MLSLIKALVKVAKSSIDLVKFKGNLMIRLIMICLWLVILMLSILFVSINSQFVVVHYYFGQVNTYFPLLLFLFLLSGVVLSVFIYFPLWVRGKNKQRQLYVKIKELQQEIINLRNIPIKDVD